MADSLTEDVLTGEVLPLALHLSKDPVANIRFTLARTLEKISPKVRHTQSLFGRKSQLICVMDSCAYGPCLECVSSSSVARPDLCVYFP